MILDMYFIYLCLYCSMATRLENWFQWLHNSIYNWKLVAPTITRFPANNALYLEIWNKLCEYGSRTSMFADHHYMNIFYRWIHLTVCFPEFEDDFCDGLNQSPVNIQTRRVVTNRRLGRISYVNFNTPTPNRLQLLNTGEQSRCMKAVRF